MSGRRSAWPLHVAPGSAPVDVDAFLRAYVDALLAVPDDNPDPTPEPDAHAPG